MDAEDPDLAILGSGELWSGDDLGKWKEEVEALGVLNAVEPKPPRGVRIDHSDV